MLVAEQLDPTRELSVEPRQLPYPHLHFLYEGELPGEVRKRLAQRGELPADGVMWSEYLLDQQALERATVIEAIAERVADELLMPSSMLGKSGSFFVL